MQPDAAVRRRLQERIVFTTKEAVSTYVAGAAYGIAALLFLFPLLDAIVAIIPMHFDEVSWRYDALERMSSAMLPSLLGILLALSMALFLEQTRIMRGISIASGVWAMIVTVVALLFVSASADVRAGSLGLHNAAFDSATTVAVLKYVAAVLVSVAFAAPAWIAARRIRHEAHLATPDEVEGPKIVMRPHRRETATV